MDTKTLTSIGERKKAYEHECSINKALHEEYLNEFEAFKQATIDEHIEKENKVREAWKKKEEKQKAKKKEFAKNQLHQRGEQ